MTQNRIEGYLKPLKGSSTLQHFIALDTETTANYIDETTQELPLRLGVAIHVSLDKNANVHRRNIYKFSSIKEFINIISNALRLSKTLFIIGHNIGFDMRVLDLPNQFNKLGWKSRPPIINGRIFMWDIDTPKGKISIIDTANFAVQSVEQLGKELNLPKQKVDFNDVTDKELYEYCIRDTEIVEKFIIIYSQFIHSNKLGSFKSTLASQSLTAWRTSFMSQPIYIHNDAVTLLIEREAYHGGRVDCFKIGTFTQDNLYYLDVNSMYPYIMKNKKLPYKWRFTTKNVNPLYLKRHFERFYCIADVTILTDKPIFAHVTDGKLLFPVGRFRTQLHHEELLYAFEYGYIEAVHFLCEYDSAYVLSDYVDFFYNVKVQAEQENNKSWRYISKNFLNSLYGKIGQQKINRILIHDEPSNAVFKINYHNTVTNEHYEELTWYGATFREIRGGEVVHSSPAIAGAITASARMLLWKYIEAANPTNVYYCDTDSLIVNLEGFINLDGYISKYELGLLKIEDTSPNFVIHGCKDYEFGNSVKYKGVPKSAIQIDVNSWKYQQWQGVKTWLSEGALGAPQIYDRIKHRISAYNKGIVNDDNTVSPFTIYGCCED